MDASTISKLSDDELLARVHSVYRRSRACTAQLIRLLVEVEHRRLHLAGAFPSLFEFCQNELGMSNGSAQRYSTAARLARQFPQIIERIARGELHMSTLLMLRDHLTAENIDQILQTVRGRKRFEVEELIATLAPRPDAPSRMRKIPTHKTGDSISHVEPQGLQPLSDARYRVQFTTGRELVDDISHVSDLMRHSNPSGDLERVFKFCVGAGLERLEGRRLGTLRTNRGPRTGGRDRARRSSARIHVPRAVRRAVFERDGERCTFHAANGRRCSATTLLELDHIVARALGGADTVENLRVRCRAHNHFHAEQVFGAAFMEERIRKHKAQTASRRENAAQNGASKAISIDSSSSNWKSKPLAKASPRKMTSRKRRARA